MPLIINSFIKKYLCFFLLVFTIFLSTQVRAQTYSTEEIVISGLGFARFSVILMADNSFSENPAASRWLRIFDRNLCWSGVFIVKGSRYSSCRTSDGADVDMKFILKIIILTTLLSFSCSQEKTEIDPEATSLIIESSDIYSINDLINVGWKKEYCI